MHLRAEMCTADATKNSARRAYLPRAWMARHIRCGYRSGMRKLYLVLALAGCGTKPDAAVDRWANHDMPPAFTRMAEGQGPLGDVAATDIARPDIARRLMRAHVSIVAAEAEAKKVTPPQDLAGLHAGFVRVADDLETDVRDMAAAVAHHDDTNFHAAHANMMNTMETWETWKQNFSQVLADKHVKLAPFPTLPELPDEK